MSYASRTAGLAQASGGSPGDALFRTLRRSDYDEDPQSWLARHEWCAHCYDLAGRAEFYGRPLSAVLDPAAAEAANAGLVTATRP